ncbi:hypothetical protein [Tahibacter sp.]|uniref:hypothetical protein n=1 Tax=Tahibacter sp. TaxID=2056211 RepID=UPI0028C3B9D2|nr:hypothetical protein [Tahibacter sp.]
MTELSDPSLDNLLRRSFAGAVADEGFTERVMHVLPARRQRPWLLPGAALAGGLLAWLALLPAPPWRQIVQEWLAGGFDMASVGVCVLLLGVSLLGCGWALAEE